MGLVKETKCCFCRRRVSAESPHRIDDARGVFCTDVCSFKDNVRRARDRMIVEKYEAGATQLETSAAMRVSLMCVNDVLRKNGVKARPNGGLVPKSKRPRVTAMSRVAARNRT